MKKLRLVPKGGRRCRASSQFLAQTLPIGAQDPPVLPVPPLGPMAVILISGEGSCVLLGCWAGLTLTPDSRDRRTARSLGSPPPGAGLCKAEAHLLLGVRARQSEPGGARLLSEGPAGEGLSSELPIGHELLSVGLGTLTLASETNWASGTTEELDKARLEHVQQIASKEARPALKMPQPCPPW